MIWHYHDFIILDHLDRFQRNETLDASSNFWAPTGVLELIALLSLMTRGKHRKSSSLLGEVQVSISQCVGSDWLVRSQTQQLKLVWTLLDLSFDFQDMLVELDSLNWLYKDLYSGKEDSDLDMKSNMLSLRPKVNAIKWVLSWVVIQSHPQLRQVPLGLVALWEVSFGFLTAALQVITKLMKLLICCYLLHVPGLQSGFCC